MSLDEEQMARVAHAGEQEKCAQMGEGFDWDEFMRLKEESPEQYSEMITQYRCAIVASGLTRSYDLAKHGLECARAALATMEMFCEQVKDELPDHDFAPVSDRFVCSQKEHVDKILAKMSEPVGSSCLIHPPVIPHTHYVAMSLGDMLYNPVNEVMDDGCRPGATISMKPSRPPQWRPIETAPKDDTYILVYQPDTLEPDMTVCVWDVHDEWWHCCDGKNPELPLRGNEPTHWMPLPHPPVNEAIEDG